MEVVYIPSNDINSDLGVVNAARVSLNKHHDTFVETEDTKLIQYLAKNNHWTPFSHSRLYFEVTWPSDTIALNFYRNYNPGGFAHMTIEGTDFIKGSVYSWLTNWQYFPMRMREYIQDILWQQFPTSASCFLPELDRPSFAHLQPALDMPEKLVYCRHYWKIATVTLRIKVPIFIARQIRTSQVGFAYSDVFVEGESFSYNEVSRRYVNDDPEFYHIDKWRVREGKNVKQGSTGLANAVVTAEILDRQGGIIDFAKTDYNFGTNKAQLAPEQLRALMPQSMYTEMYWTGTLHRFAQWLDLRLDSHVQEETRYFAEEVLEVLSGQFPAWYTEYASDKWN